MGYVPLRGEPAQGLVVLDGFLEPARPQLEQRPLPAGQQLRQAQAEFAGQLVRLVHMLKTVLGASLCGLHAGQRDERITGQVILSGGLG